MGGMMRGGAGQEMGVIASRFPPPPPARRYRYKFDWARPSENPLSMSNPLLRSLVTIPPSLIPLPSFVFVFIFLPVYRTLFPKSHPPIRTCRFFSHSHHFLQTHPSPPLPPAGSLKTPLSREEAKVLFCLISSLSPMWRKRS